MEIGNIQRGRNLSEEQKLQREKDLLNNECTKFHTKGCRPWKCGKNRAGANNLESHSNSNDNNTL